MARYWIRKETKEGKTVYSVYEKTVEKRGAWNLIETKSDRKEAKNFVAGRTQEGPSIVAPTEQETENTETVANQTRLKKLNKSLNDLIVKTGFRDMTKEEKGELDKISDEIVRVSQIVQLATNEKALKLD